MNRRNLIAAALAVLGLALAGCSTTGGDYSSLPPAPKHPPGGPEPGPTTVSVAPMPSLPGAEKLVAEEYADLLDRIRVGYALPQVQHYAVDREIEWYRSRPDFLDRTFRRGSRYLHYIVTEIERRGLPLELALLPVVESALYALQEAYAHSTSPSSAWDQAGTLVPNCNARYGCLIQCTRKQEKEQDANKYNLLHSERFCYNCGLRFINSLGSEKILTTTGTELSQQSDFISFNCFTCIFSARFDHINQGCESWIFCKSLLVPVINLLANHGYLKCTKGIIENHVVGRNS